MIVVQVTQGVVIKNMLKPLDLAVKNEKSYSELLCIVEKLTHEGITLELTIEHLRHLYAQISDSYDDELGDDKLLFLSHHQVASLIEST